MSPTDFNRALDRFAQKTLARATEHTVRQSGERLLAQIRENTPVRTGAARDAWTMRIEGSGFSARVVISNPLPYVVDLEHGTSTQAPQGIVGVSIEEVRTR